MNHTEPNLWKGFILGAAGSVAGVIAMAYYWKGASALSGGDPRKQSGNAQPKSLDSISLIGQHHEENESSTAAVGRIAYQLITGKEPESQETRAMLSYLVHWAFSTLAGGGYGAIRCYSGVPEVIGGELS